MATDRDIARQGNVHARAVADSRATRAMRAGEIVCADCGLGAIDPNRDYMEIRGWVRRRAAGGANQVQQKIETGRWIHATCYDVRKAGGTRPMFAD